ncbi:MAG: STAS domain-containing protein [Treponema sp.]|nr:STAS domain-containing protein [Treponema sp.]MCI5665824.1 STAS domain-containing protein [Spirochaetia bacterium]MDD7768827.1 STAS domain-containing protein [Treponema sp.]MDY3130912.1 STAS domain-containing protein [Treponema sp.]
MEQLTIIEKEGANYKQFVMEGALNAYTVGEFQDNLYKAVLENNVVLDMSKLIEMDPSGMGVLMAAFNDCADAGYKLYFMSMSNEAERTISSSGFKSLFHIISSVTEVK